MNCCRHTINLINEGSSFQVTGPDLAKDHVINFCNMKKCIIIEKSGFINFRRICLSYINTNIPFRTVRFDNKCIFLGFGGFINIFITGSDFHLAYHYPCQDFMNLGTPEIIARLHKSLKCILHIV